MGKTTKRPPHLANLRNDFSTISLTHSIKDWLTDGRISQLSPCTIEERRAFGDKLLWFLQYKQFEMCGLRELRAFIEYLGTAHLERGGRWANPLMTNPLRSITTL